MRARIALAGIAAVAAAGLGFAIAQEDPIGQMIQNAPEPEAPPPAPGETPASAAAPAVVEPKVEEKVTPPPSQAVAKKEEQQQTAAPGRRPRYPIAILLAMDKITAESVRFEARVDRPVSYKGLVFTVRACETSAPDERVQDAIANVEVAFRPPAPPRGNRPGLRQVFRGWMFASSPSLSPLEHPVYDAWLIACKADAPLAPAVQIQAPVTSAEPKVQPKLGPAVSAPRPNVDTPPLAPPVVTPAPGASPTEPAAVPAPAAKAAPEPKAAPAPNAAESIPIY
jgi:hypothetical protein